MRAARWAAAVSMVLAIAMFVAVPLHAEDKAKDLIVGKWEPEKQPQGAKVVIEFTKDGKVLMTGSGPDKKEFKMEGKYRLPDDKTMEVTFEQNGKSKTDKTTIVKITKDELVTKDDKAKEEQTFKRVK